MLGDTEGDVLRHRQMGEQGVVLEHHADATLLRRQGKPRLGNDVAGQLDFAFVHRLETRDGAQGRGLAAAGRAKQAANVACIQMQIQVLDDALVAVAAGKVAQVEQ